ncbi:Cna B-type domain-containing protein [Clostridiaceae bacterium NSJ-31]|uniref:Cna B-type domain-containing protein n=1 Tax=Ligaoa zhengdingensis TaxID=2763658 RepID=A0A926I4X1_9FIRM|nr:SpaA isopeptide-forming pilin-related protein [Ligaoa zhengdingensis]MBC8546845.1 Cna B-type domain-containing protein [Ligaoa zhengdingensis]
MTKDLVTQVKQYLSGHKRRNRFAAILCVLSLTTVLGVSLMMTMPAISLEQAEPLLETDVTSAVQGAGITVRVTAAAQPKQDETYFLLSSENWNAGLADIHEFTGDVAEVAADDGSILELHRVPGENGDADYWFCLEQGRAVSFDLHCAVREAAAQPEDVTKPGEDPAAPADEPEPAQPEAESSAPEEENSASAPGEEPAQAGEEAADEPEPTQPEDAALPEAESSAPEEKNSASAPGEEPAQAGKEATDEVVVEADKSGEKPAAPADGPELAQPEDVAPPEAESSASEEENSEENSASAPEEEPAQEVQPEAVASMTITAGGGGTLDEAAAAVEGRKADAEYRPLVLTWLAEEPLAEQTLTASLFTDETGEHPLAGEGTLITVSGALPQGASVRAYPVPVQMEDATVLGAYDITIYRPDGSAFEPRAGLPLTVEIRLPQMAADGAPPADYAVYYVPESGGPEGIEATAEDGGVRFSASHFSTYAVVSPAAEAPAGDMNLQVVKQWSDGNSAHSGDSVEVRLYANSEPTGRTLTLNAGNEWTGAFEGLSPEDAEGQPIDYSVREEDVAGYLAAYHTETIPGGDTWEEVTTLEDGGVYRFVADGQALACYSSGNSLQAAQDDAADELQQWTATAVDGGFRLANVSRGNRWIRYNSGFTTATNAGNSSALQLDASGRLYYASRNSTRYVRVWPILGTIDDTTSSSLATRFTVYKKGEARPDSYKVTITNWKVEEPLDDFKLQHHKRVDYLGDGQNPDTALTGDGFYRLYLDISGRQQPVDLLLVVDQSNSMQENEDMRDDEGNRINRIAAVNNLLSGNDGFIRTFLSLNEQNQIAISTFGGKFYKNGVDGDRFTDTDYADGYRYTTDSSVYRGWGRDGDATDLKALVDGTNYEAGLLRAEEMFSLPAVQNNGHKKIMVFLSDGGPTYYIDDDGDRQGDGSTENVREVISGTEDAVDAFCTANSGVTIYSIGFGSSLNADVLEYMAKRGNGAYYAAANFSGLEEALAQVIQQSKNTDVTISDSMSAYVRLPEGQSDVKMTMKAPNSEEPVVLYENGAVTEAGEGILEDVIYTPSQEEDSTGTVEARFCEGYFLNAAYVYTLSFNVEVTEAAYQKYLETGEYPHIGDPDTDYGEDGASAGQAGFRSNLSAEVSYVVDGSAYSEQYGHPVVQIVTGELAIVKHGETADGPLLPGAGFALYRAELVDGEWVKTGDALREGATSATGTLTFTGLLPGRYLLYETQAPTGYKLPKEPWRVEVTAQGVSVEGLTPSDGAYAIINAVSYVLPSTGGRGAAPVCLTGLLLAAGSYLLLKKHRSRRSMRGD